MALKDLQTQLRFCANIDVLTKIEKVVTSDINLDDDDSPIIKYDSQISNIIEQVSQTIKYALAEYYSVSNLETTSTWINNIVAKATNSTENSRLMAAEVGSNAIVETFIIKFTSNTEYTVEGMLSGSVGSGTTTTKFTSNSGGDLVIDASTYSNIWNGNFSSGDVVYISTNKYNKKVAQVATYIAAGEVMRTIAYAQAINPDEGIINTFINHGKRELKRLADPYSDEGYELDNLPDYEIEDISLGNWEVDKNKFGEWKDKEEWIKD